MGEKAVRSLRTAEYDKLLVLLKQLRKEANLTQLELCEKLGQEKTYVSKVERGTRRFDVIELFEYANALALDPVEIVGRLKGLIGSDKRSPT